MKALIVSTAHWRGDPRLNRHLDYLRESGIEADFAVFDSDNKAVRILNILRVIGELRRARWHTVILPDPELFIVGSIAARFLGIRSVIDVHEDYSKAAASREWIPRPLRQAVGAIASLNDRLGRRIASRVVVAAPELASSGSILVSNVPNPDRLRPEPANFGVPTAIYIGDVTAARGALEIAELAGLLPDVSFLVIGPINDDLRGRMIAVAGPDASLEMAGRLPHDEAWARASGAIAGLSLLRPLPAYRSAVATKLWEYGAAGIPPVVTDLPGQRTFVSGIDISLAQSDIRDIASVITRLATDHAWQLETAAKARIAAIAGWERDRPDIAILSAVQP